MVLLIHLVHHLKDLHNRKSSKLCKAHKLGSKTISVFLLQSLSWSYSYPFTSSLIPSHVTSPYIFQMNQFSLFSSSLICFEWPPKNSAVHITIQVYLLEPPAIQLVPSRFLRLFFPYFLTIQKVSSEWFFIFPLNVCCRERRLTCTSQHSYWSF